MPHETKKPVFNCHYDLSTLFALTALTLWARQNSDCSKSRGCPRQRLFFYNFVPLLYVDYDITACRLLLAPEHERGVRSYFAHEEHSSRGRMLTVQFSRLPRGKRSSLESLVANTYCSVILPAEKPRDKIAVAFAKLWSRFFSSFFCHDQSGILRRAIVLSCDVCSFSGVVLSKDEEVKLVAVAAAVQWAREHADASVGRKADSRLENRRWCWCRICVSP